MSIDDYTIIKISMRKFDEEFDYWLEQVDTQKLIIYIRNHERKQTSVLMPHNLSKDLENEIRRAV